MTAACPDDNQLGQLVDGALTGPERERVERHLDHCTACGVLVAELAWLVAPMPTARAWRDAAARAPDEVLALWRRAIAAVAALHRAGAIHGDLSAERVFVTDTGDVVIGPPGAGGAGAASAPERLHGAPPSARADQFALCAATWTAVTGRPPFTGATPGALAVQMLSPPPIPAARPDRAILAVLVRGLAADPARRFPDLDALLAALDHPTRPRRRLAVLIAAGLAAIALALAVISAT